MNGTMLQDPLKVLRDLAPLREPLWNALVDGCDRGVQYHEQNQLAHVDPWVHAALTRQWALDYLTRRGIEDLGFSLRSENNAGIYLTSPQYRIRVLKVERRHNSETGELVAGVPTPRSGSRERYYRQPMLGQYSDVRAPIFRGMEPAGKLVALWETDASFQLTALDLVCTKGVSADKTDVEYYWRVPFGTDGLTGVAAPDRAPSSLPDFDLPSLPTSRGIAESM